MSKQIYDTCLGTINSLEKLLIGGVNQWVMMRGQNNNNPILLFLHGGPGSSQIGYARHFQQELEKDFVVVNWDQRGAGLSFSTSIPRDSMCLNQFVSDTIEIVEFLRRRFLQKKIYIVGYSFGSIIGLLTVKQRPDLFYAYFAVSQVVNWVENDIVSYQLLMEEARRTNNKKALSQLLSIGEPPWKHISREKIHQKWLDVFHVGIAHSSIVSLRLLRDILFGRDYSIIDWLHFLRGRSYSRSLLWHELQTVHLSEQVPSVCIPIIFCIGRHDYTTPSHLAEAFYYRLRAPKKDLFYFEHSAHTPMFEEPIQFANCVKQCANYHNK